MKAKNETLSDTLFFYSCLCVMTVIVDMLNTVEYRFYKSHLIHETTIRKRLNKYGLSGRRTPPKKTMAGQLRIAKLRMTKPMFGQYAEHV